MQTIEMGGAAGRAATWGAGSGRRPARAPAWAYACGLAAMVTLSAGAKAETLFDSLIGSWVGSGHIRYDNGQSEGVRCNAYYTGGGDRLRMAIRCKSASTEVEIRGELAAQGDKLSGTWEERTFNASGDASGRVVGDKMSLSVTGGGFKGAMSVASSGSKQVVTISTEGIRMRSVNVTLAKG